jgi:hypothetical protein
MSTDSTPSLPQVAALVAQLSPKEKLQLVEQIARGLAATPVAQPASRRSWREIRDMMASPMLGEDAQAWVSRTRRESDQSREQGRLTP